MRRAYTGSMIYVNGYEMTQAYGGPEEGGWWRTVYSPLACLPVDVSPAIVPCEDCADWTAEERRTDTCEACEDCRTVRAPLATMAYWPEVAGAVAAVLAAVEPFKANRPMHSAAGGNDLCVCIESSFPASHAYPAGGYE